MGASGSSSFLGSGSQRYCTIRLHRPRSTSFIFILDFVLLDAEVRAGCDMWSYLYHVVGEWRYDEHISRMKWGVNLR